MKKTEFHFPKYSDEMLEALKNGNVLLVAKGKENQPNPMTIGWGSIMYAWKKPIFMAMVRSSRHTYKLLEEGNSFTVNFFTKDFKKEIGFCGTKSGRDYNKFQETGLTPISAKTIDTPVIKEAFINLECIIINKGNMDPQSLENSIFTQHYSLDNIPGKDLHVYFYGEIVSMYRNENSNDDVIETVYKDNWL